MSKLSIKKYFLKRHGYLECIGYIYQNIKLKKNREVFDFISKFINGDLYYKSKDNLRLRKTAYIESGATTIVFKSKNPDQIIGLTNDIFKVLYLKKAEIEDFKLIKTLEIKIKNECHLAFLYSMNKLTELHEFDYDYSEKLSDSLEYAEGEIEIQNVLSEFDIKDSINEKTLDSLSEHRFSNSVSFSMDIHAGQFMVNKSGDFICVDPIISSNISY